MAKRDDIYSEQIHCVRLNRFQRSEQTLLLIFSSTYGQDVNTIQQKVGFDYSRYTSKKVQIGGKQIHSLWEQLS